MSSIRTLSLGLAVIAAICLAMIAMEARAVGLTYVEGDPEFSFNVGPLSAFASSNANDGFWGKRVDFGAGVTIWESQAVEDSPEIVQTISGLNPGQQYDVYAVYWSDNDENWPMQAGLAPNTYAATYSWAGAIGPNTIAGSVKGIPAALAQWEPAGVPPAGPVAQGIQLYTQRVTNPPTATTFGTDDPLVMLLGKAGTIAADGGGNIQVYMNDLPAPGGARRAWYDGVAYRPADTPILTPTAALNRDTGTITITNPTSAALSIKGIRIESAAGTNATGSLNGPAWTSVASGNANWTAIADPSIAIPAGTAPGATPFANNLVETGTTNISIAANGGSLNLGGVWNRSPFDNLVVHLWLADDTLAVISPDVTGAVRVITDLNGDSQIDLTDYQSLLANIHTSIAGLTRIAGLRKGDITGDGLVNYDDFSAFRTAYNLAHGAGAFELMAASVPEPGSLALALGMIALVWKLGRSRAWALCLLMTIGIVCGAGSKTAHAVNIKVDIDSTRTSGTVAAGGPLFTQAGFTSWNLTDLPIAGASTVVDGITLTLTGGTSGNNAGFAGVNQSRARYSGTAPNQTGNGGGGPQNNILSDFVYNEGAAGREIVLNMTGLPVGNYLMYSWHNDQTLAAGDATTVIVADAGGGSAQTVATGVAFGATPISYFFEVTNAGVGKQVTFRAAGSGNRSRLNGFSIETPIELTLKVYTLTGQMEIVNEQGVNLDMSYYEIRSTAGSLRPNLWTSLDDGEIGSNGDFNSNGVVDGADYVVWRKSGGSQANYDLWRSNFGQPGSSGDPIGSGWDEVPSSSTNILSELNLTSLKTFAPTNTVGLGPAFELGGVRDLAFYYSSPTDGSLRRGIVKYITSGSGSSLDGGAVPEPASFALGMFALSLAFGLRRGR